MVILFIAYAERFAKVAAVIDRGQERRYIGNVEERRGPCAPLSTHPLTPERISQARAQGPSLRRVRDFTQYSMPCRGNVKLISAVMEEFEAPGIFREGGSLALAIGGRLC
jgi:hypothetical protein